MSCPHVTGAAVYVKTFHPDWSPSAIKFALMTRAFPLNPTTNPDAEFGYGVGHIDPVKVVRPGLVYDALEGDYLKFLCRIGYTTEQTKLVSGAENDCPKNFKGSVKDLNYPSIVSFVANATFSRTITNVGVANSTYKGHNHLSIQFKDQCETQYSFVPGSTRKPVFCCDGFSNVIESF